MKKHYLLVLLAVICTMSFGQINVNSLSELRTAVQNSDQEIILAAGDYNIEVLPNNQRNFPCTGSNNTITLTDVYLEVPVASTDDNIFDITGDNVTIIGGHIENTYYNGMTEVVDFEAYNNDRDRLANGAGVHIRVNEEADGTTVIGTKMTVRGSFPYGYGSLFGIGGGGTSFGLSKRSALSVDGPNVLIDGVEVQMQAFGHGIFFGGAATNSVLKNSLVEGVLRPTNEILAEGPNSLPGQTGYRAHGGDDIEPNEMVSLSEDGIRAYPLSGTITVENCVVKKMRGGIRLYLGGEATVKNCTAIDCGNTNYNLPTNSIVENCYGNFTSATLDDNRLSRSRITGEWTIIPSPNAVGEHNITNILGNNQNLVFHRTDGPLDDQEKRAMVVEGSNSTIVNETEYTIILEAGTSGNDVTSCGTVIDNGSNTINRLDCDFEITCDNTTDNLEAECFDNMSGIAVEEINTNNDAVAYIENGDWISFNALDLSKQGIATAVVSAQTDGNAIEVRAGSTTGDLLGTIQVPNTSSYGNYQEVSVELDQSFNGVTDLYFVFTGGGGYLFNVDEIRFEENPCSEIIDPTIPVQLEDYCEASGVGLAYLVNDNQEVDNINEGDYLKMSNVNFDLVDFNSIDFLASSSTAGGTVEFRVGTIDGELLTSIEITNTGGWDQYEMFDNYTFTDVSGIQDLFVVFKGDDGFLFNADYFYFRYNPCAEIVDAFSRTEALEYCDGYQVIPIRDEYLGGIHDGDWIRFGSVDFGSISPSSVTLNLSGLSTTDGVVSIMLNDPISGTQIATATVPATNGWENWEEVVVSVDETVTGIQDLYIYFGGGAYNIDWFQFYKDPCDGSFVKDATQIEAEDFCEMSNVAIENSANNVTDIGSIKNGSWVKYSNYDLTDMKSIEASVTTSTVGGAIEVRLDDENGEVLTTLDVSTTGGWDNWELVNSNIANVTGVHDIYVTFTGGTNYLFNIDWLRFSEQEVIITNVADRTFSDVSIYPNPTSGVVHFTSETNYQIIDALGYIIQEGTGTSTDLSDAPSGLYILKIQAVDAISTLSIVKQ